MNEDREPSPEGLGPAGFDPSREHLAPDLCVALDQLDFASRNLAETARVVQSSCSHRTWCEKPTYDSAYGSALGPTRICLRCRKEVHGRAFSDWMNSWGRGLGHPEGAVVLSESQLGIKSVYALRLPVRDSNSNPEGENGEAG